MSKRAELIIIYDLQRKKVHFTSTELARNDTWYDLSGTLFETVEQLMVNHGLAHNVTIVERVREVGGCEDYRVIYNTPKASDSQSDTQNGASAKDKPASPLFDVCLSFQYPAWDCADGIWYRGIEARSKREAVRTARLSAQLDGHLCGGMGRASFRAIKVDR